jgi:LEA14-like dessication related protein
MKSLFTFAALMLILNSCSLTSTTYIQANDAFVLGNNQHGRFSVKLKNLAVNDLILWKAPIDGGQHSPITVKPNETVKVKVERNTAVKIENNNPAEATVELIVKGDTGLSMGYKNQ